tara:strand:+ start:270 stop:935 length:666 start_codon:yes stop_codon:yes gene_type:complete
MSKKGKGKSDPGADGFTDRELQDTHGSERKVREGLFLPFFLFLIACAWFAWGSISLFVDANGFSLNPERQLTEAEIEAQKIRAQEMQTEILFKNSCGACHQANGAGIPGSFPPLDGSDWLDNGQRVISLTLVGMSGPVEVMGQQYNSLMPKIAETYNLKDEDIVSVVNYVRRSWSNASKEYAEVTLEDVAAARKALEERPDPAAPWTAEDVLKQYPFGAAD